MFYKLGFLLLLSVQIRSVDCRKLQHTDEPVCTSRYDFEEKLLEKMVKLSHAFDVLEEKVVELEANLEQKIRVHIGCPDGWVVFGESCYSFHETNMDFIAASNFCAVSGGTLVHIETDGENTFVQSLLRKVKGDKFWIGLTDSKEEGAWVFSGTNTISGYLDWAGGQPNQGRTANCGAIWEQFDYHWVDEPCSNKFQPVCEKKKGN